MVETALSSLYLFCMIFGCIFLSIAGYFQLSADGAAYVSARLSVMNSTANNTYLASSFPASKFLSSQMKPMPSANTALPPTDYHYSQSTSRHGGLGTIQATQNEVLISNKEPISLFGFPIYIQGTYAEPTILEYGAAHNVMGDTSFTGLNGHAENFFNSPDDAPPYFVALADMAQCPTGTGAWNTCPMVTYTTLGLAEELDDNNWARTTPGLSPQPTAMFWEMLYHQQVFATFALNVSEYATFDEASNSGRFTFTENNLLQTIYGWDATPASGDTMPPGDAQINPGN